MDFWIDSHTHLDIIEKQPVHQQKLVDRLDVQNIKAVITVSTDIKSYFSGKTLSLNNPDTVFCTCGLYPSHAENYDGSLKKSLTDQLDEGIAVALGECGLDYYRNYATPDLQKTLFRDQVRLAKTYHLPIVIHAREAYEDVYTILKQEGPPDGGVMHCYGGDAHYAKRFMDIGFYISFAGNVTYKKADDLRESCKSVPLHRLLLETDAPYLTPLPHRGEKNHPGMLVHTAQYVAELKNVSLNELSQATCQNAINLFKLNLHYQ
ncbi:MAG: TatD family hydrolase [bacterium]|nr:MAG: TatD family hydrolase [bacterium]